MKRIETGIVQFGDDWPGVFLRGDSAIAFKLALDEVLRTSTASDYPLTLVESLRDLLADTNVSSGVVPTRLVLEGEVEKNVDQEAIVRWLRALGGRCPEMSMAERRYWYEGVADDIEQGNGTLDLIRKELKS